MSLKQGYKSNTNWNVQKTFDFLSLPMAQVSAPQPQSKAMVMDDGIVTDGPHGQSLQWRQELCTLVKRLEEHKPGL